MFTLILFSPLTLLGLAANSSIFTLIISFFVGGERPRGGLAARCLE
jgi:hypothetical protein